MPACRPEDVHRRFAEAVNAGDLEALAELYPARGGAAPNHDGLRDLLALKPQISVETRSVVRAGKVALLGSRWHLAGTTPEGRAVTLAGTGTEMVERQTDGSWRYVVEPESTGRLLH